MTQHRVESVANAENQSGARLNHPLYAYVRWALHGPAKFILIE